jgi:hypothetical protein
MNRLLIKLALALCPRAGFYPCSDHAHHDGVPCLSCFRVSR